MIDRIAQEIDARRLSLREVARRIGQASASRVGAYLKHRIIPGPDVLRRLCLAVGLSPIDLLWQAKYYDAVFDDFISLYRLGWSWMREDGVDLDPHRGAAFGSEHWGPGRVDLSGVPPQYALRYHQATIYNSAGRMGIVALPLPMACAFLLMIGLFLRRGDRLRPEVKQPIILLTAIAPRFLPQAQLARGAPSAALLRKPFKEAARILPRRYTSHHTRLALVSEHVQSWCDMMCLGYAEYARLALYSQGGYVGEPVKNNMIDENIWNWQRADPLSIDDLRMTKG
ncbi:MAG TPA: helix-turn-helix transcriptional regulator [Candidatus Cybelea sp.]